MRRSVTSMFVEDSGWEINAIAQGQLVAHGLLPNLRHPGIDRQEDVLP